MAEVHDQDRSPPGVQVIWFCDVFMPLTMNKTHWIVALTTAGVVIILSILPAEQSINIIGNASFAASFLSYAQSEIIKLRLIAIASLCMGLIYNTYTHLQMPEGQGIALVIFWLALFLIQNIYKALVEVSQSIEARVDAAERQLLVAGFPAMHSKDWQSLAKNAKRRNLAKGDAILKAGDSTTSLMLLASGHACERRVDGLPSLVRRPGTFWGELTWSLGASRFDKSPCEVLITSETADLWEWDYATLDGLTQKNARLLAALRDGFLRSACFKHGLLAPRENDPSPVWNELQALA
jgi:hypothetical protein